MLFSVTVPDGDKKFTIIYHVSKEQIESAIENTIENAGKSNIVKPDFAIVLDKRNKYKTYEVESMDIAPNTKQMIMCGNFEILEADSQKDSFETLKTLTFK